MGTVWLDATEIGTFTPDTEGTSGDVNLDAVDVGDFLLGPSGYVYLNGTKIGYYTAAGAPPPPPPPLGLAPDPRLQTKEFLDTYLKPSEIIKDDGSPAVFAVIWAVPDYPLSREFRASSNPVDLLFVVGKPDSKPMLDSDLTPYGYREEVPIETYCIDKSGVTATKLKWTAETQLRRVLEEHAFGSHRSLSRSENNDQWIGGTYVFSDRFILTYIRDTS